MRWLSRAGDTVGQSSSHSTTYSSPHTTSSTSHTPTDDSLGFVLFSQGDYAAARTLMEESLESFRELDLKWDNAGCLEGLAAVVAAQGEWTWAVQLLSAAQALCEAITAVLPPAAGSTPL